MRICSLMPLSYSYYFICNHGCFFLHQASTYLLQTELICWILNLDRHVMPVIFTALCDSLKVFSGCMKFFMSVDPFNTFQTNVSFWVKILKIDLLLWIIGFSEIIFLNKKCIDAYILDFWIIEYYLCNKLFIWTV